MKKIIIALSLLTSNITITYSPIDFPTDMTLWSQFINRLHDNGSCFGAYLSFGPGGRIDKNNPDAFTNEDFALIDVNYYFSYKSLYAKLRRSEVVTIADVGDKGEAKSKASVRNIDLGYNFIHRKNASLGVSFAASVLSTEQYTNRLVTALTNVDKLQGWGAGLSGFYLFFDRIDTKQDSLGIYIDTRARYLAGPKFCFRPVPVAPEEGGVSKFVCFREKLEISCLVDTTLMFEYTKRNWIFDIGCTIHSALGIKGSISRSMYNKFDKTNVYIYKSWEQYPDRISYNSFLSVGYNWGNEEKRVVPFIGLTTDFLHTPKYQVVGIFLKGGVTF